MSKFFLALAITAIPIQDNNMARRIFGTQGYNPRSVDFQATTEVPLVNSPALKDFITEKAKTKQQELEAVQKNTAGLELLQDSLGIKLSPGNQKTFDALKQSSGIDNMFQEINPQQLSNPYLLSSYKNKVDEFMSRPEVVRVIESEANAESFYRNALKLPQGLREKAIENYNTAINSGADDMYGLNINDYSPINIDDNILTGIGRVNTSVAGSEIIDGKRVDFVKKDPEAVKEYFRNKMSADPRFKNNWEITYGDRYESIDEFVDNLDENGALVTKRYAPKDIETEEDEKKVVTYKDVMKNMTSKQKKVMELILEREGTTLDEEADEDLLNQIKLLISENPDLDAEVIAEEYKKGKGPKPEKTERKFGNVEDLYPKGYESVLVKEGEVLPKKEVVSEMSEPNAILRDLLIDTTEVSPDIAKQRGFDSAYDVPFAYGEYVEIPEGKKLTELTLGEVKELQNQQIEATKPLEDVAGKGKGTGAMGYYQITKGTLEDLQKTLGLGDDVLFSAETQDAMFNALLERRGLNKFLSGDLSKEEFAKNLSSEWEGIAKMDTKKLSDTLDMLIQGQQSEAQEDSVNWLQIAKDSLQARTQRQQ